MTTYTSAEKLIAMIEAAHVLSVIKVNVERGDTIESDLDVLDRSLASMKQMQADQLADMQAARPSVAA